MAGYSGTPLASKLGIRPGSRVGTIGAPDGFPALLEPLPEGVHVSATGAEPADIVIVFATSRTAIVPRLDRAASRIPADGAVWVAWPKRSSAIPTDLTEDVMRELFLPKGLVDNKVCAIDETWSGLRFVVRRENRSAWPKRGS